MDDKERQSADRAGQTPEQIVQFCVLCRSGSHSREGHLASLRKAQDISETPAVQKTTEYY